MYSTNARLWKGCFSVKDVRFSIIQLKWKRQFRVNTFATCALSRPICNNQEFTFLSKVFLNPKFLLLSLRTFHITTIPRFAAKLSVSADERKSRETGEIANVPMTAEREKGKACKDLFNYLNPPTITVMSFCCNKYR